MVRMLTESSPLGAANPAAPVVCGVRALLLAAACTLLCGCGTLYLMQAASGEWQGLRRRGALRTPPGGPHTPPAPRPRPGGGGGSRWVRRHYLPRARSPAAVRARRFRIQRGVRHHGRGRGTRALADAAGRVAAPAAVARAPDARRGVREPAGAQPHPARAAVCLGCGAR